MGIIISVRSNLHISLGLELSTQLSTLTRELPTVAAHSTIASASVTSTKQLTRNGSTKGLVGRGGGGVGGRAIQPK